MGFYIVEEIFLFGFGQIGKFNGGVEFEVIGIDLFLKFGNECVQTNKSVNRIPANPNFCCDPIHMLLDAGVKTYIHYVLGKNIIDEAWADALDAGCGFMRIKKP